MSEETKNEKVHPNIEENLKSRSTWWRFFYMILFVFALWIASIVLGALVIFQFLFTLFTGEPNLRVLNFSQGLCTYCYQVLRFLTYNSEDQPFPFSDWPAKPPA